MDDTAQEREVDRNYEAFQSHLPQLIRQYAHQHALMRHGQIVALYNNASDALKAGGERFADGIYSVQEVTDRPIDLGFFSHAIYPRIA